MTPIESRKKLVRGAKRIVVKVGSGVLTGSSGLNTAALGRLAEDMAALRSQKKEIILVSSGAIAVGFKKVGLVEKPKTIRHFQACAAIGQAGLMNAWEKAFKKQDHQVAQVLLTADDLANRRRYLNARNTLTTLLEWQVIPIINENDTVVVAELKFGDNDTLAGMVTILIQADLFINLTDIDGLYDRDPRNDPQARFIPQVESIGAKVEAMASKIPGALGAGGMYTKIVAARRVSRRGVPSIIANGKKKSILHDILQGRPQGTLFLPKTKPMDSRKHWIAFASKPKGRAVVDSGAQKALITGKKSLLPSGVLEVEGKFDIGDTIQVVGPDHELAAIGLCNYSSEELLKIAGCQTARIESLLGYKHSDEVIHRDNMVAGDDAKI